jgi:hypothetical protein
MELLYSYNQEKIEQKNNLKSNCEINLSGDETYLQYTAKYILEYIRLGDKNILTFEHNLVLNKLNGSFSVGYRIINNKKNKYSLYKTTNRVSKNNFDLLLELTQRGFYSGEKRFNFWGVKYKRACIDMYKIFSNQLNMPIVVEKDSYLNPLYDMFVDYILKIKKIKAHDSVYWDIRYVFPKNKWLKLNENKFVPAVLDQYGIKSRYLIGALSTRSKENEKINLKSLRFICSLFGDNYIDYIKDFDWKSISSDEVKYSKPFTCENESEKRAIANSLKTYSEAEQIIFNDNILITIQKLFVLKKFLADNGLNLKIKARSATELNSLYEQWELHKKHIKLGYKTAYYVPEDMASEIQETIEYSGLTFKPMMILSEDQFKIEGLLMKNCMAKQFPMGQLYYHIAISCGKRRINVQYRKGTLNQARGKTNKDISADFELAVEILSERMKKFAHISPVKIKYDFINR